VSGETSGETALGSLCGTEVMHEGIFDSASARGNWPASVYVFTVNLMSLCLTRMAALRTEMMKRRDPCTGCLCLWHCVGDCAANAMDTGAHVDKPADRCLITHVFTRDLLVETLQRREVNPQLDVSKA
jgi:hypothetical protein